jgi:CheY-like chemotaxis protein
MNKKRIVVGEDDQAIRGTLSEFLESLNYEVVPTGARYSWP